MTSLAIRPIEPSATATAVTAAGEERLSIWSDLVDQHLKGPARVLVCGDGPLVAHWIAAAPRGVRVENVGNGAGAIGMIDFLLGRDRHGEIAAVLVALDDDAAEAATALSNLRAVRERSFHDARILADWSGAEDDEDFSAADVLVAEASCWTASAEAVVVRRSAA